MKILFHTTDKQEAISTKWLLEERGIPVFVANENTGPALGYLFADKYTIWVCLDEQLIDAQKSLSDGNHVVESPVNVQDYYRFIEVERKAAANKNYDRIMSGFVILVVLGFVAWGYTRGAFT